MNDDARDLTLLVNGEEHAVSAPITVAGLLRHLRVDARHAAVERNRKLVRRTEFDDVRLEDGDRIEIVSFVGGG